jgi:hypothetical protein
LWELVLGEPFLGFMARFLFSQLARLPKAPRLRANAHTNEFGKSP